MNKTYKLGGDIEVNRLGYGGMQLTGPGTFGDVADRPGAIEIIRAAAAAGVNFFDTADAYGPHTNESLFADALAPYERPRAVIATKGGFTRPGPGQWVVNGNPNYLRQCIDGSLQRLKLKTIDLWQLHRVDDKVALEESLAPVVEAVAAGKIKHVGLSEVTVAQVEQAQRILPIASVQNLYNVSQRRWDDVLDYTAQNGLAFIPWFPLGSGPDGLGRPIQVLAAKRKVSVAQLALAWLLKRSNNILLIPGTKSLTHLRENLDAGSIELSDAEFASLR